MGGKGSGVHSGGWRGGGRPKKNKPPEETKKKILYAKEPDAVTWLEWYPEDTPLARENLAARDKGYDNDAIRHLMAAICLQTCIDYQRALSRLKYYDDEKARYALRECEGFFESDIFQTISNYTPPEKIKRAIRRMPPGTIVYLWQKIMDNKDGEHLDFGIIQTAKNTTTIIGEQSV